MAEETEEPSHDRSIEAEHKRCEPRGRSPEQPETDGSGEAGRSEGQEGNGRTPEGEQRTGPLKLYDLDADFRREAPSRRTDEWRRPISIDWARVVHSPSFRRLQGKTQVFPGHESDFFRNRLTHSLEVAQIAEGIADKINHSDPGAFGGDLIDARLCAAAALMHDLGHAPFGHNGERALDDLMRQYGGFEGNAQSLRIVARLEKKFTRKPEHDSIFDDEDPRLGLNLTYRSLASILKYDRKIPHVRKKGSKLVKGYYGSEEMLVSRIKDTLIAGRKKRDKFKTVECSIMDLADDIAYSTYDLEDCLKAGFLTPAKIMSSSEKTLALVADKVSEAIRRPFKPSEVLKTFDKVFEDTINTSFFLKDDPDDNEQEIRLKRLDQFAEYYNASNDLAVNGDKRGELSSKLVSFAIRNVRLNLDQTHPILSSVYLLPEAQERVEVLKQYTYYTTIDSPRVKVAEFRGYEVVKDVFKALASDKGQVLMPEDLRDLYDAASGDISTQRRVICDFVAGMTDRYAIEFYARLHSDSAQSMFKPL